MFLSGLIKSKYKWHPKVSFLWQPDAKTSMRDLTYYTNKNASRWILFQQVQLAHFPLRCLRHFTNHRPCHFMHNPNEKFRSC